MKTRFVCAVLALMFVQRVAAGQNVDLVTLPSRDTVQLTIYNSEDLTLAKETRSITLRKGRNQLQFSWAGTLIDPTSVELRPLEQADKIEVADTVFPGQKPQHLIWNIESDFEGQALMEVSYFTSGLTWAMDYVATANPEETKLAFNGHVRVFNSSGEQYENAEVRLIVGKINLVEKIAELARRTGIQPPQPQSQAYAKMEKGELRKTLGDLEGQVRGGYGMPMDVKKVVKEGVGEYFMFSVEGTETIRNGWSKRMPAVRADDVKFDIVYRMRAYQYGLRPVRFFIWENDEEHQLGDSPLPNGIVRIFRENGRDGLSYLGQQNLEYVPIQADIEVNLGTDDLVVIDHRKTKTRRDNFRFHPRNRNLVTGWDEHQNWNAKIRNYHPKPIAFELRLQLPGDVELSPGSPTTSFSFNTVETKFQIDTRDQADYDFATTIHHAANAKQNRVLLKPAQ